jgi:flagellar hook-associated protein 2
VNGQIILTDGTTGDSQLSLTMSVSQSGGGAINLGRMLTTTTGRLREVVAGTNASVRVDGVVIERSSNNISDALAGVTLNLQGAEPGTSSTLTIDRDNDGIVKVFSELAAAYNELVKFRDEQSKSGAPLYLNSSLRAGMGTLTNAILASVTGATAPYTTAGIAGLSLQKDGSLKLDADVFKAALGGNLAAVTRLFTTAGYATSSDVTYFTSTSKSKAGSYAVDITAAATTATVTGAGFSGTYVDDATADTMTISEALSGKSGDIQLANGDTTDTIVGKLNAMFRPTDFRSLRRRVATTSASRGRNTARLPRSR